MTSTSLNPAGIGILSATILERDLNQCILELEAYRMEAHLWVLEGQVKNSGGNLALHTAGSIQHFIGAVLGKNGYLRNRDREFSDRGITRPEIIARLRQAIAVVKEVLPPLTEEALAQDLPEKIGGNTISIGLFLLHVISHVKYHLGQLNYHRCLLDQ